MSHMRAVMLRQPGGAEELRLETLPMPKPSADQVLIRVKAFGLNRSEMFTRQGHSPDVKLPRVLGIEAVGLVEVAPSGGGLQPGDVVATAMGGMGRAFDGGYAEFTCVPASQVRRLHTALPWETLGALPEMLQTAWGSLYTALEMAAGERLLIRGGTTSIGLAAAQLARAAGVRVLSTTRNPANEALLRAAGASEVLIDDGALAERVRASAPDGVDKVLELVGVTSLLDSLRCVRPRGVVCLTGIVGGKWTLDQFTPSEAIPSAVRLTRYGGTAQDFMKTPLQDIVDRIEAGALAVHVGKVFQMSNIAEAHRCMEENRAGGKIVILT